MPLIECPDCHNLISDRSPACIHCGCPTTPKDAAVPVAVRPRFTCPTCGSEDVKTLGIVHSSGSMRSNSASVLIGGAGGDLGVGMASTAGVNQSALSKSVAPPEQRRPDFGKGALGGCIFMFIAPILGFAASSISVFLIVFFLAFFVWFLIHSQEKRDAETWNATEWPPLKATWDNSVMCMRCGTRWELDAP
jgi:hypothetical protein